MSPSEFMHPEDAAALRQMESIPGFPAFVKGILSLGLETMLYGVNMASSLRLSSRQLSDIYKHLPPICNKLGIPEPEFYLSMDPNPNAWTFGDTKIFITVTSGLLDMMDDAELDAVLAHECGHILCHHVLYHSVARYIMSGFDALGVLGKLTLPIQLAFLYWQRKSELTCDRVGAFITSPEVVCRTMARLAAGPKSLTQNINMSEWAGQADKYDSIWNSGNWNKALQIYAIAGQNHPFSAVRVREIIKWGQSTQYHNLKRNTGNLLQHKCPNCGRIIDGDWRNYCNFCGTKLK